MFIFGDFFCADTTGRVSGLTSWSPERLLSSALAWRQMFAGVTYNYFAMKVVIAAELS